MAFVTEPTLVQAGKLRPALSGPPGFKGCSTSSDLETGTMHTALVHSSDHRYFLPSSLGYRPVLSLFPKLFLRGGLALSSSHNHHTHKTSVVSHP